ncbi:MAG: WYL domain-containing protein [Oscillospiraceae bacterium]|jgi:predicted DNA-binding transcriptional regulator YafY|nr:WYL domain-containing protein [Oscillospiraceae bacterium]
MPRSTKQKLKLLYILKLLLENTDEEHRLSVADMIGMLEKEGVSAERKSIYDDISLLREYGIDIGKTGGKKHAYYIESREFELAELKLLVDIIQSSKFITVKKSTELIGKIGKLTSRHEAAALSRQVYVSSRIKSMNESIYYNVDKIHTAISRAEKIRFKYYDNDIDFNSKKKIVRKYRKDGGEYLISPWALIWGDDNYYMVGFDSEADMAKHYRVDKMSGIELAGLKRDGGEKFEKFNPAVYSRSLFGMYGGKKEIVRMRVKSGFSGIIADRFGEEAFYFPEGGEYFIVSAEVVVSPQFLSWVFGLGDAIEIMSPESVRRAYRDELDLLREKYI